MAVLARFDAGDQGFDYQLALAVTHAVAGRSDDALKELRLARLRRPNTDDRVLITQYTYADICTRLFEATHNVRFRDVALDWAKVRQRVEPWQSWSYSLQARLSPDAKERDRAIAMTYYLDPKSETLATLTKAQVDAAVAAFGRENIFLETTAHEKRNGTI